MSDVPGPDAPPAAITAEQVCAMCALDPPHARLYYGPSPKHTAFFTLVWAAKQGVKVDLPARYLADEDGALLAERALQDQIKRIGENLASSGQVIEDLQHKDAKAWELLRIQLEKSLSRYDCRHTDKQDALGSALLKVWELLVRLPRPQWIESFPNAIAAIAEAGAVTRIFDFTVPFYAYAGRIARNELLTILRKKQAPDDAGQEQNGDPSDERSGQPEPGYTIDWEAFVENGFGDKSEAEHIASYVQAWVALRANAMRLLKEIDKLPQRQCQVMQLTLGARPQFLRALVVLELPAPPAIAEHSTGLADDAAIAERMGCSPNLVRVTRHNAERRIRRNDIELGDLLSQFIEANRAKTSKAESSPINVSAGQA